MPTKWVLGTWLGVGFLSGVSVYSVMSGWPVLAGFGVGLTVFNAGLAATTSGMYVLSLAKGL